MVATKILVALVEAPWDGKAGDDAAEKVLGFVRAQNRRAGSVPILFSGLLVELLQRALPVLPMEDVVLADGFVRSEQGRKGLLSRLRPHCAKARSEEHTSELQSLRHL